jgi:hypothetical protein
MRTAESREPAEPARRRLWPLLVPVVLVVALAILWTGLWFYAASAAEGAISGWIEREAKAGRVYACAERNITGFPLRIAVHCNKANWQLSGVEPPLMLRFTSLDAVWQVYQPLLVTGQFTGPMAISAPGESPNYVATWQHGQSSLRGTPKAPESLSIVVEKVNIDRLTAESAAPVAKADRIEAGGRIVDGSVTDNPVIELMVQLAAATAPDVHPLLAKPLDGEASALLKGLANFSPKPWRERMRELQARDGTIEITKARVQSGEVIATAAGTLKLNERGNLDGQLQLTVVKLEEILRALNLEEVMSQGRIGNTINALDRLMPGLGSIARQNAAPSIMAGLGAIGQRTVLEDKPAVSVPLRFADGTVMLGPFALGRVPPLF